MSVIILLSGLLVGADDSPQPQQPVPAQQSSAEELRKQYEQRREQLLQYLRERSEQDAGDVYERSLFRLLNQDKAPGRSERARILHFDDAIPLPANVV